MAITFVGKGAFAGGAGGLTVAVPGGYQADDLLVILAESAHQTVSTPPGWSSLGYAGTGTAGAAGGVRITVFYKWATASESSVAITDSGDHTTAQMVCFRNVDPDTPFDATGGYTASLQSSAGTVWSCPSITTLSPDALVCLCVANDRDGNSTATLSGWTNANLSSLTERIDQTTNSGSGGGLGLATGVKAAAGATGTTSLTSATSNTAAFITFALRDFNVSRYWVGGGGTWDKARTANWAYTSGGSAGAPAPSYRHHAVFDANAGGGSVTVADVVSCKDFTLTGFTGAFYETNTISVFGEFKAASAVNCFASFPGHLSLFSENADFGGWPYSSASISIYGPNTGPCSIADSALSCAGLMFSPSGSLNLAGKSFTTTSYIDVYVQAGGTLDLSNAVLNASGAHLRCGLVAGGQITTTGMQANAGGNSLVVKTNAYGQGDVLIPTLTITSSGLTFDGATIGTLTTQAGLANATVWVGAGGLSVTHININGTGPTNITTFKASYPGVTYPVTKLGGESVLLDWCYIQGLGATPAGAWSAGHDCTDGGYNTGWTFGVSQGNAQWAHYSGSDWILRDNRRWDGAQWTVVPQVNCKYWNGTTWNAVP